METSNGIATITDVEKKVHSTKRRFWHVNKATLPFKIHYFLFIGGLGVMMPYESAIGITRLGLTAGNLAMAYTLQQLIFILSNPCIGYLADKFDKLKDIIIWLTVIQALFFFFLTVIPSTDGKSISESNSSLNHTHMCKLCTMYEDFYSKFHNVQMSEFDEMLSCYDKRNNSLIKCSNLDNFDAININILDKTCDVPVVQETVTTIFPDIYPALMSNMLFVVSFSNDSRNFRSVCLPPENFPMIRKSISPYSVNKYCRSISDTVTFKQSHLSDIPEINFTTCGSYSEYLSIQDESSPSTTTDNFKTYRFWLFTLCIVVISVCELSLFTVSDTACYESVQGVNFGQQRTWGAVSWGLMAPLAGFLNDYTQGYLLSCVLLVILYCLQIWNLSRLNLAKPEFSANILKDVKTVFKSKELLAFELGVLMNGIFTGVVWFYLTWYVTSIGGDEFVIGLVHAIECFLGEMPVMIFSDWMIKKFGHFNLVSLALLSHGIRFFLYSYIHNPWWILPIECLHGFSYGSFISAMTSYGKIKAKPGTETTTQAILSITFDGIGAGLGCVIIGVFFDSYGAHTTFFFTSFICFLATFINVAFTVLFWCRK